MIKDNSNNLDKLVNEYIENERFKGNRKAPSMLKYGTRKMISLSAPGAFMRA